MNKEIAILNEPKQQSGMVIVGNLVDLGMMDCILMSFFLLMKKIKSVEFEIPI